MRRLLTFFKLWCVRFADNAGWLLNVREDVVNSYIESLRPWSLDLPRSRSYNSPTFTFATVATAVFAALFFVATYPAFRPPSIWLSQNKKAITLYDQLIAAQRTIETRSESPPPSIEGSLAQSRLQLTNFVVQLHESEALSTKRLGRPQPDMMGEGLDTIFRVLRLDEFSGQQVSVTLPSQPATAASVRASYDLADQSAALAQSSLNHLGTMVSSLGPSVYAYAARTPRVEITRAEALSRSSESLNLNFNHTETRLPKDLANWRGFVAENGKPFPLADINAGDSLASIAGGIVFGKSSRQMGDHDLAHWILTYDITKQRLALVGPEAQIYYSAPIEPQSLRALNAFVLSGQANAVSVGWSGVRRDASDFGSMVLLDPAFVDTKIGQDLVRADSLPWEFSQPSVSKWDNPMAAAFDSAQKKYRTEFSEELGQYLSLSHLTPETLRSLLEKVRSNPGLLDAKMKSCSIEPEFIELFFLLLQAQKPKLPQSAALAEIQDIILRRTTLATLYDESPSFSMESANLILRSGLKYRYVTGKIDYGVSLRFGECLGGHDVIPLKMLDQLVNNHISDIVTAFPVLRNILDYASIAAFLRWAREPGNLQAVDFYSLTSISQHDPQKTPTPDFILH
jgi:hypothetical protein